SVGYQDERAEFESGDLSRILISAISAKCAISAINSETGLSTKEITDEIKELAKDEEWGIDPETVNSKKVGRILGRLRFKKVPRKNGNEARKWQVDLAHLAHLKAVFSLTDTLPQINGTNGTLGTNGTPK